MRSAVASNGFEYYEYVLCYVDDVLCISKNPMAIIKGIQDKFTLKGDKAEVPNDYLGAVLEKMTTVSGVECWTQSADKYLAESVKNVEATLAEKGNKLPSKGVALASILNIHYHQHRHHEFITFAITKVPNFHTLRYWDVFRDWIFINTNIHRKEEE